MLVFLRKFLAKVFVTEEDGNDGAVEEGTSGGDEGDDDLRFVNEKFNWKSEKGGH